MGGLVGGLYATDRDSKQLSAFRDQEFHAITLVTSAGGIIVRSPEGWLSSVHPAWAAWYEAGRFDLDSRVWQTHQSTNTGMGSSTRIGVFGVTLSFDEDGKARWRSSAGRCVN